MQKVSSDSEEDDVDVTKSREKTEEEITAALSEVTVNEDTENKNNELNKLFYKRIARHYLGDEARKDNRQAVLTAAAYHRKTRILVTGIVFII